MPLTIGAHGVLANAEMQVAAAVVVGLEVAGAFERQARLGRGRKIGRAADQPRNCCAIAFSTLPDESRVAMPFGVGGKSADRASQPVGSSRCCMRSIRRRARDTRRGKSSNRPAMRRAAARPRSPMPALEMLAHAVRHEELRVFRPAVAALRQTDFFLAERLAVRRAGVLLVRRAVADVAVDDDQRRPVVRALGSLDAPRRSSRSLASPTCVTFQP